MWYIHIYSSFFSFIHFSKCLPRRLNKRLGRWGKMNLGQTASFWTKGWVESTEVNCSLFFSLLLFQFPDKVLRHSLSSRHSCFCGCKHNTHNSVAGQLFIVLDNSVECRVYVCTSLDLQSIKMTKKWHNQPSQMLIIIYRLVYINQKPNWIEWKKGKYKELKLIFMKVHHMRSVYTVTINCQFTALSVNLKQNTLKLLDVFFDRRLY